VIKLKLAIIALAVFAFVQQSHAADLLCHGTLIEQRGEAGYSLGECDLNSVSSKQFERIRAVCGEPNGVGEDSNKTICYVGAVVVPKKNVPGVKLVTKVYFIDAEQP
jgi:hypothetical protein